MAEDALFIQHRTKPGKRDDVEAVWRKHIKPTVAANDDHVTYPMASVKIRKAAAHSRANPIGKLPRRSSRPRNTRPTTTKSRRSSWGNHHRARRPVV